MRCPKCGYITFDHLEICPECNKNIAKISEQLSGNIFKAEAPAFLKFTVDEPEMATEASVDIPAETEDTELDIAFEENDIPDIEFSLEAEESIDDSSPVAAGLAKKDVDPALQKDDLEKMPVALGTLDEEKNDVVFADDEEFSNFDLDKETEEHADKGKDDMVFSDEKDFAGLALDKEDKESTDEDADPRIDFSELNIADLAPPETEEKKAAVDALTASSESPVTTTASAPSSSPETHGAILEDLQTDGFNLDLPSSTSLHSAFGQKMRSTIKTGTALDDFDFNLDELIADKEK